MNSNQNIKRILCYGDSNTWGYIPGTGKRFPKDIRWTGLLQHKLGSDYEIIEEGLNSRTINIDDPKHTGKNGKTYLLPCLESQSPLDLVILLLGTNDLKERFSRIPEQIASDIESLVTMIKSVDYNEDVIPNILLMAPTLVDESVEGVKEKYLGAEKKSKQLGALYKEIAEIHKLLFIDLSQFVKPSKIDGYHFDADAHAIVADVLRYKLKEEL